MLMDRFPRFSSYDDDGEEEEISLSVIPPPCIPQLVYREDSLPIFIPEPVLQLYRRHEEEPEVYINLPPTIPPFHFASSQEVDGLFPKEKVWQVSACLGVSPPPSLQPTLEYVRFDSLPPTMCIPSPPKRQHAANQYYETERFVDSEEEEDAVEDASQRIEAIPPTFYDNDSVGSSQNVVEPSQFISGQEGEENCVVEPTQGFGGEEEVDLSPRVRHLRKRPTYLVRAPTHCTNEAELTFYSHDTSTKRALPPIRFRTLPQDDYNTNDAPLSSIFHRFATSPTSYTAAAAGKKKRAKFSTPVDDEVIECDDDDAAITTPQIAAKSRNKPHPHFTPPPPPALRQASMLTFVTKRPSSKPIVDDPMAWIKPTKQKL